MAQLKIKSKFSPDPYPFIKRNGRPKRGNFCRACGSPLSDPVSIARGYGRECWENIPVIIILEIPEGQPNTACSGQVETSAKSEDSNE
jgi:hypothetical protein